MNGSEHNSDEPGSEVRQHSIDTIAAIATPPGRGGIGVIRISGPDAATITQQLCGRLPQPRLASLCSFLDGEGEPIDTGLVLYFPAPASFTGEDVIELQGHGGPVILGLLLQRAISLGARQARPGEFSERAFLNNKLDLSQAEAIADLISSGTDTAARAAQRSMAGVFSRQVNVLQEKMTAIRVFVEAAIDFPEEEIDFLADSDVLERLHSARGEVSNLLQEAQQGQLLRDGVVIAILGRPNAGKSSLLNALSGEDRAIVTHIPGTTRDVLREWINLDGIPVHVADTAGIRATDDPIEAEGVRRARKARSTADLVLLVMDPGDELLPQQELLREVEGASPVIVVQNKCDLFPSPVSLLAVDRPSGGAASCQHPTREVQVSALTGQGLDRLKTEIKAVLGATDQPTGSFSARQRHVDALRQAGRHLELGERRLREDRAPELLAEELRLAQQQLGEITGQTLADDLLGAIFSSFCIGK